MTNLTNVVAAMNPISDIILVSCFFFVLVTFVFMLCRLIVQAITEAIEGNNPKDDDSVLSDAMGIISRAETENDIIELSHCGGEVFHIWVISKATGKGAALFRRNEHSAKHEFKSQCFLYNAELV